MLNLKNTNDHLSVNCVEQFLFFSLIFDCFHINPHLYKYKDSVLWQETDTD